MALSDASSLLFTARADTSDARSEFRKFKDEIGDTVAVGKKGETGFAGLSSSLTGLTAGLNPATLALTGGAAALTGMAVAAVAVTRTLLDFSVQAADFGSKIFDASTKTGLTAETLSSLKFAAEQAGSSFEQVTKGATVFGIAIGEAANGSDKALAKLKALGVTSTDTDTALAQVFKTIADAETPTERLALATEAFGKKIGPDLIPLIMDANGSLEEMRKKADAAGATLSSEAAAGADKFGDQMDLLNTQLAGVARTIGISVMPIFLEWGTYLSDFLTRNKDQITAWANGFAAALKFVVKTIVNNIDAFAGLAQILVAIKTMDYDAAAAGIQRIGKAIADQRDAWATLTGSKPSFGTEGGGGGARPTGLPDVEGDEAAKQRAKEREEIAKRDAAARVEILKNQLKNALEAYDDYNKQLEAKIKEGQFKGAGALGTLRANTLNAELAQIIPALEAAEDAQSDSLKKTTNETVLLKQEQTDRIDEINKKQAENQQRLNAAIAEAEKKNAKDSVDNAKKAAEDRLSIRQAETDRLTAQLDLELQRKYLSEVDYIRRIGQERVALLEIEREGETDKTKIAVLDAKIAEQKLKNIKDIEEAEREAHERRKERWNERIQQMKEESDAETADLERKTRESHESGMVTAEGSFGGELAGALGVDLVPVFEQVTDAMGNATTQMITFQDRMKMVASDINGMVAGAIGGMINGLAQMGAAWLAGGKITAKAALQMAASITLSLAQQAGMKALFEFAEGLAALAVFNFTSAGLHFSAAKMYGTVAAIAGVAGVGLGLAARSAGGGESAGGGKAFGQETKGAFGTAGGSGSSRDGGKVYSASGDDETIIEVMRNRNSMRGGLPVRVEVAFTERPGWFGDALSAEVKSNGKARAVIIDAAAGAV